MLKLSYLENTNPLSSTHDAWLRDGVSLLCAFSHVSSVQEFTSLVATTEHVAAKFSMHRVPHLSLQSQRLGAQVGMGRMPKSYYLQTLSPPQPVQFSK